MAVDDDDEFADIDWSAAIDLDPTQQMGATAENDNSVMNQTPCNQSHNVVPSGSIVQQQNPMAAPASTSADDMEALRNQILRLQNELLSKDETINDLQNTAVSTQLESSHRIKAAEEEAQRKIHLVQEELRRVKMEADKYKGSWVRSKKRVTELESNQSGKNGTSTTARTTNRVSHDNNNSNDNLETIVNHLSAFGFPTDIETRRVTPSNLFGNNQSESHGGGHECAPTNTTTAGQQLFESDTTTAVVSGSKRKMMEQPLVVGSADLTTALPRKFISQTMFQYESLSKHDTVAQRLARHLIMRDDMGCYSLTAMELSLLEVTSQNHSVKPHATANANESSRAIQHSMQQSLAREEETRSHFRSILHQVLDIDGTASDLKHISSSGLFFILLASLNSSFSSVKTKVEDDNNHSMEQDSTLVCESVPSISVLHILRVMCDILLLSAKARDDLRYWLYHSQQQKSLNAGPSSLSPVHSRIEGLSSNQIQSVSNDSKEALWTSTCRATLVERGNEWDPMTMSQPCSAFFGILVALMKGHSYGSKYFDLESKGNMKLLLREQAIRLVLTLMSDAPHYRIESVGRTPYLWKYWFDSLFQTSVMTGVDAENMTGQVEDFFSIWEVSNGRGNGRKRCSRPMAQEAPKSNKHKRSSNNGAVHSYKRDATDEKEEHLSVKVKCGIIQLLTHLMVSSSSAHKAIFEPTGQQSLPLARRVLAAILDEVDDCIIPSLSPHKKVQPQTVMNYLQLCYSCNQFILALARSNEGLPMMRYQMRVESGTDGETHWSHSAISCMVLILNSVLSCAIDMEREEITPKWAADLTPYLNCIAEQCIAFFKTLQSFAHKQNRNSSKSRPLTFASLISEQHLVLLSCFQKLSTRDEQNEDAVSGTCLLWIRDELKYDVQVMMEEALYDDV
eukprot:scaffold6846_cov164-Skeletonema_menzelii.AAC.7